MRLLIQHRSDYIYPGEASLGPHLIRLRPASHTRASVESYSLQFEPDAELRWQQDPYGNHIARITFPKGSTTDRFSVLVELAVEVRPVNPFDFLVDDRCQQVPFSYPAELRPELRPFLDLDDPALARGPRFERLLKELPREGETVSLMVEINRIINERIAYVIREEPGVWTPEETLGHGRGSCRDSGLLLAAALRSRGFAARFVSGYLVQLTDEGMIPDEPRGVDRDVVDLHAWAEVYLPGAGWVGLDATSGLLCGEGHIPLACTATPALAAPIEGTSDRAADSVSFAMTVGRLGHEPRPTTPYTEETFAALRALGAEIDARLQDSGVILTMGGEPTFTSREHPDEPEWQGDALGPTKWSQGARFAKELHRRLCPGGLLLTRSGKHYPGESLPRWAIDVLGWRDGRAVWQNVKPETLSRTADAEAAAAVMKEIASRLDVASYVIPAYEDPWRFLQEEANLPIEVDPLEADLDDPEERRRLARVLGAGLGNPAGFVLPLARPDGEWRSDTWKFRRGNLFLLVGDSSVGLRLPLKSLLPGAPPPPPFPEEPLDPPDPRVDGEDQAPEEDGDSVPADWRPLRTALTVQARESAVWVFMPPLASATDFFDLIEVVDAARRKVGVPVRIEGYPPPSAKSVYRLTVTPDPGVLEVNVPATDNLAAYAALLEEVFDAALHAGLATEKYLLDGRLAGSGGGNHLTLGGPTPLESPFLKRPDLFASVLTFFQHHPSLSYLFTGLFVGPTSQAPRLDEARHDALYELEIALERAFAENETEEPPPPWLTDLLFRNLLVDVAGNTHRTEICIDKLFDPGSPHGRQGLLEFRAFEMPPHIRMAEAQMVLLRAIVAAFVDRPYRGSLIRWGQALHDRFLLPYYLWRDFEDVLAALADRGISLDPDVFRPFLELRCPLAGRMQAGEVTLEVRNAIEPWPVLGEQVTVSGTSRFVDSSMERLEVRADGLVRGRHQVVVNGLELPMRPTEQAGLSVAGVRFRAWAPPHSLQAHLGIHHPLQFDVIDTWARRSLGACAYHVWHPEGRAFNASPLTRFEASARRAQRFTVGQPSQWPVQTLPSTVHADTPHTIDLRLYPLDHPPPEPVEDDEDSGTGERGGSEAAS